MNVNCNIPLPVNLNCWKHHAGFIKKQIKSVVREKINDPELKKVLLVIGESQMDIYLGKLIPTQIVKEVIGILKKNNRFKLNDFKKWLYEEGQDYKLITIRDKTVWTLRLGKGQEKYIHIHPGRYSPLTIRVKSSTLKTYILSEIFSSHEKEYGDLSIINKVRAEFLDLPPLKSISSSGGLLRLRSIFNNVNV